MLVWTPAWAVALRHIRLWRHNPNALLSAFYWPLLDILIWGFLGTWIQQYEITALHNYTLAALLGILLWQVVGRGSTLMVISFAEEIWTQNVVTLFSLPLRLVEWMGGVLLFAAITTLVMSLLCIACIAALYQIEFTYLVRTFLLFLPPMFLSTIGLGFFCLQIVLLIGHRGTELGFVLAWFLAPFSGAYYPLEILPAWAQTISSFLPMSYLLQGMRHYVMKNEDPTPFLIKGYIIGALYCIVAITLFVYRFNKSKRKGLGSLIH
jgi:ABC-2 type transport system permease protein